MKQFDIIKNNNDFKLIFEKGHSIYGKYLVVYFLRNQFEDNRFGFCVGKKLGTAVVRNRIKRLLREAVRNGNTPPSVKGYDILLVARVPIKEIRLSRIIEEIEHILCKVKN